MLKNAFISVCVPSQVFDLQTGQLADELLVAEGDTVNGCDAHPFLNLLAVSTGEHLLCLMCEGCVCVQRDHRRIVLPFVFTPSLSYTLPCQHTGHRRFPVAVDILADSDDSSSDEDEQRNPSTAGVQQQHTHTSDSAHSEPARKKRRKEQRQKWSQTDDRGDVTNALRVRDLLA